MIDIIVVVYILQDGAQECTAVELVDQFQVTDIGGIETPGIDSEPLDHMVQVN